MSKKSKIYQLKVADPLNSTNDQLYKKYLHILSKSKLVKNGTIDPEKSRFDSKHIGIKHNGSSYKSYTENQLNSTDESVKKIELTY